MTSQRRIRLFLDSNVLTGGIVSPWGLDKATLSLCAAKVCRLVLAEVVRDEVEENLLLHAERLPSVDADQLIEDYRRLIRLTNPELVPYPDKDLVLSSRHLIRHAADVPVLLSAVASKPDWVLTHNTKHFTKAVARRTSLRIATPAEFFRALSALFRVDLFAIAQTENKGGHSRRQVPRRDGPRVRFGRPFVFSLPQMEKVPKRISAGRTGRRLTPSVPGMEARFLGIVVWPMVEFKADLGLN